MAAEAQLPRLEDLIGRPATPPLRIHHIMAGMAAVAIMLSICYSLRQSDPHGFSRTFDSGFGFTMAITSALAATMVVFGFAWRGQSYSFLDQPGHWLLLTQSLLASVFVMGAIIDALQFPASHIVSSELMVLVFVVMNLLMIGLNLYAAKRFSKSAPWLLVFLLEGLPLVFVFTFEWLRLGMFVSTFLRAFPIAMLISLTIAAWSDRRRQMSCDWPHWLGICLKAVPMLHILGEPIWSLLVSMLSA